MNRRRTALLALIAALTPPGCAGPPPPAAPSAIGLEAVTRDSGAPDTGSPDAAAADADAAEAATGRCLSPDDTPDEVFGGAWVSFYAPPYNGDSGVSSGPPWGFRPQGLPAISSDGARLLYYRIDESMGAPPSLDLVVERIQDQHVLSATPLLDVTAFRAAHAVAEDLEGRRSAFDALKRRTIARVRDVNATLDAEGWQSLTPCTIDVAASDTNPWCAMTEQQIQCGSAVRLAYAEPRLDLWMGGRKATSRRLARAGTPRPELGNGHAAIPVRGCFGKAFFDAARGLVLAQMSYACHGAGGDGCGATSPWSTIALPSKSGAAAAPKAAAKDTCPAGTVAIPAGSFTMGSPDGNDDERPPHEKKVGAFCLDTREVTVADYRACLAAGRCFTPRTSRLAGLGAWEAPAEETTCNFTVRGRDGHPMNCIPSSFAAEYCNWSGKRLPSEAEWELAARGAEGRRYPWGDAAPGVEMCWNKASSGTCAAGSSAADASPLGVLDMAGNVREWTSTTYALYDGCMEQQAFVTRGGSFEANKPEALRGAARTSESPARRAGDVGFRCAMTK